MEDWQGDNLHAQWTLGPNEVFGENFLIFQTDAYIAARTLEFCEFACLGRKDFKAALVSHG